MKEFERDLEESVVAGMWEEGERPLLGGMAGAKAWRYNLCFKQGMVPSG